MDSTTVIKIAVQFALTGIMHILIADECIFISIENEVTNTRVKQRIEVQENSIIVRTADNYLNEETIDTFSADYENGHWIDSNDTALLFVDKGIKYENLTAESWQKRVSRNWSNKKNNSYTETVQIRSNVLLPQKINSVDPRMLKFLPLYQRIIINEAIPPFLLHEYLIDRTGKKRDIWKVTSISYEQVSTSEIAKIRASWGFN